MGKLQALVLWAALFTFGLTFRHIARIVAARRVPAERLLMIGDADSYARIDHKLEMGAINARLVGRMSLRRVSDLSVEERPVDEDTLADAIRSVRADRILVVPSQTNPQVTLDVIRATKALGVRISIVPHVFDVVGHSVVFDDLGGMTLLGVREFALARSSGLIKRAFDLAGAIAGLMVVGPFLLLAALAIKLDSPGPVFFRQERIGRHGRSFRIFKLRTMDADAEAQKAGLRARQRGQGPVQDRRRPARHARRADPAQDVAGRAAAAAQRAARRDVDGRPAAADRQRGRDDHRLRPPPARAHAGHDGPLADHGLGAGADARDGQDRLPLRDHVEPVRRPEDPAAHRPLHVGPARAVAVAGRRGTRRATVARRMTVVPAATNALARADRALLRVARTAGHTPARERRVRAFSKLGEHAAVWLALGAAGAARDTAAAQAVAHRHRHASPRRTSRTPGSSSWSSAGARSSTASRR